MGWRLTLVVGLMIIGAEAWAIRGGSWHTTTVVDTDTGEVLFSRKAQLPLPDLNMKFARVNVVNPSWVASLSQAPACVGLLSNRPPRELGLSIQSGQLTLTLDNQHLAQVEAGSITRTATYFSMGEWIPETIWIQLPDWVTLALRINEDGRRLTLDLYRPKLEPHSLRLIEAEAI